MPSTNEIDRAPPGAARCAITPIKLRNGRVILVRTTALEAIDTILARRIGPNWSDVLRDELLDALADSLDLTRASG